jgi:hypothetical protein
MVVFELFSAGLILFSLSALVSADTRPLGWTNIEFDQDVR